MAYAPKLETFAGSRRRVAVAVTIPPPQGQPHAAPSGVSACACAKIFPKPISFPPSPMPTVSLPASVRAVTKASIPGTSGGIGVPRIVWRTPCTFVPNFPDCHRRVVLPGARDHLGIGESRRLDDFKPAAEARAERLDHRHNRSLDEDIGAFAEAGERVGEHCRSQSARQSRRAGRTRQPCR